jgi:hypothetical protein
MTYAQATFLLSLFGPPLLYLTGYGIYRWAWGNGWDSHERYMSSEAAKVLREERLKDSGAEVRRSSRESAPASAPEHSLYDCDPDFALPQPAYRFDGVRS